MEAFIAELRNGEINANDALGKLMEMVRNQQPTGTALSVSVYLRMPQIVCRCVDYDCCLVPIIYILVVCVYN